MPSSVLRRRHPDVGQHDVGPPLLDLPQQRVGVAALRLELDLRRAREHLAQPLAHEVAVFAEDRRGSPRAASMPTSRSITQACALARRRAPLNGFDA